MRHKLLLHQISDEKTLDVVLAYGPGMRERSTPAYYAFLHEVFERVFATRDAKLMRQFYVWFMQQHPTWMCARYLTVYSYEYPFDALSVTRRISASYVDATFADVHKFLAHTTLENFEPVMKITGNMATQDNERERDHLRHTVNQSALILKHSMIAMKSKVRECGLTLAMSAVSDPATCAAARSYTGSRMFERHTLKMIISYMY